MPRWESATAFRPVRPLSPADAVILQRRPPAKKEGERHHGEANDADGDVGRPPIGEVENEPDEQGPNDASEIISAGGQGDRDPAALAEPMRDVGNQRSERSGRSDPDKDALYQRELPYGFRHCRRNEACGQSESGDDQRKNDSEAVDVAADYYVAEGETGHR